MEDSAQLLWQAYVCVYMNYLCNTLKYLHALIEFSDGGRETKC